MQTLHNIHSKFNDGFWRLLSNLFNVNSSLLATNQNRSLHTRKIKYDVVKEKNKILNEETKKEKNETTKKELNETTNKEMNETINKDSMNEKLMMKQKHTCGNQWTKKRYFGFPTKMLSIRPGTRRSSGGYSVVNRRVYYGSFQAKSQSETQNASRSCRVLSVNFYRYKRVLIKMIVIVLSYVPAYISNTKFHETFGVP